MASSSEIILLGAGTTRAWHPGGVFSMLRTGRFLFLFAGALVCVSAWANPITGLGTAANYLVLDYGAGSQFSISGGSTITNGLMGIGPGGTYNLSGGTNTLQAYQGDTGSNSSGINVVTGTGGSGGTVNSALNTAISNAQAAYAADAALTPTQTVSAQVQAATTFTSSGTGAVNVIQLTNGINLNGTNNITIAGDATSYFIFLVDPTDANTSNSFTLTAGNGTILENGIDPTHILWLYGGTNAVAMNGGSVAGNTFDGTVISPNAQIGIHDHTFDGSFIAGQSITITSNPVVNLDSLSGGVSPTPEPASFSLMIGAGLLAAGLARRRAPRSKA
jgi:hypothetical protein